MWALDRPASTLLAIDPRGRRETLRIPLGAGADPVDVAFGGGAAWVAEAGTGRLTRVAADGKVTARVPACAQCVALALDGRRIWAISRPDSRLVRVNARPPHRAGRVKADRAAASVAVGLGAVWVTNTRGGTVSRFHGRTGRRLGAPVKVGREPVSIARGRGMMWVVAAGDRRLVALDRRGRVRSRVKLAASPIDVAAGLGAVWVAHVDGGTVTRIRPGRQPRVVDRIRTGGSPSSVAVGFGRVWVASGEDGWVRAITP